MKTIKAINAELAPMYYLDSYGRYQRSDCYLELVRGYLSITQTTVSDSAVWESVPIISIQAAIKLGFLLTPTGTYKYAPDEIYQEVK